MTLRHARAIFHLDSRVSMETLNGLFRELVKKYHPDKVRDYPEWAHERMAEINEAYELLAQRISEPIQQEQSYPEEEPVSHDDFDETPAPYSTPLTKEEEITFYPAFDIFLDGLALYYQYGLDTPSYRNEGIRRFRYRDALRIMRKGQDAIENCNKMFQHPIITAVSRFIRLTIADIYLGDIQISPKPLYGQYDRRMKKARESFDEAVTGILFPELVPNHRRGRAHLNLYPSYAEFVIYLTVFEKGERRKIGILETARYDSFMTLIELHSAGLFTFFYSNT